MQLTTLTTLTTLFLGALAVPAPAPVVGELQGQQQQQQLASRATQLIDLWADANFLGLKYTGSADKGQCVDLPSSFRSNISSGKARAGLKCTTWVNTGCSGTGFSFISSAKFDSWVDNKSKSWKCIAN